MHTHTQIWAFEMQDYSVNPVKRWIETFRLATESEIKTAQQWDGAPHVMFACLCGHRDYWTAKNIALSDKGGYTGARNIFPNYMLPECSCPSSNLRYVVPCDR